uniref:Ig-like domain-containing protein n=1 Tax=Ficedula albicollis TaxID=59894 RepID=A0A803W207_FICAL
LVVLSFAESWNDCGLFLLSAAVTGQVALEQHPREVTVREGDAVTFQCNMVGDVMNKHLLYWYRQGLQGMVWICRIRNTCGEVFQDHFKIRDERLKNRFPLQILASKQGDTATYYCGARITLEQLCSRMDQKLPDGEDRYLSISF